MSLDKLRKRHRADDDQRRRDFWSRPGWGWLAPDLVLLAGVVGGVWLLSAMDWWIMVVAGAAAVAIVTKRVVVHRRARPVGRAATSPRTPASPPRP
jgi:hypothetical protein